MRRPTSLQSVKKTASLLATLTIFPVATFCTIVPNAAATEQSSKVPQKAEAVSFNSGAIKPLFTQGKATIEVVALSGFPHTSIADEESGMTTLEMNVVQSDFANSNGVVHVIDMVILPQPLDRFTL